MSSVPTRRTHPRKSPSSQNAVSKSHDFHPGPDIPEERKVIKVHRLRDHLAVAQVVAATNIPSGFDPSGEWIGPSSVALYQDFQAADPVDSILARLMVGISDMSMDALSRAMRTNQFDVRELELKSATNGALVIVKLARVFDERRDRAKQTVNVGQVNVEAGGQAVVGNVNSGSRDSEMPQDATPMDTMPGDTPNKERGGAD